MGLGFESQPDHKRIEVEKLLSFIFLIIVIKNVNELIESIQNNESVLFITHRFSTETIITIFWKGNDSFWWSRWYLSSINKRRNIKYFMKQKTQTRIPEIETYLDNWDENDDVSCILFSKNTDTIKPYQLFYGSNGNR